MKGSPVRVRPSALRKPRKRGVFVWPDSPRPPLRRADAQFCGVIADLRSVEERENKAALRIIRAGVLTTWVVAGVSLVYLLATWSAGHRPLLLATAAVATLDGAVIF